MVPATAGLVVGGVAALALSGVVSHLVWGVPPTDVVTFGGAALTLFAGALLACWLPARKAVTVDPVRALQND
jgi:putative ABC transport system permease protein